MYTFLDRKNGELVATVARANNGGLTVTYPCGTRENIDPSNAVAFMGFMCGNFNRV